MNRPKEKRPAGRRVPKPTRLKSLRLTRGVSCSVITLKVELVGGHIGYSNALLALGRHAVRNIPKSS